nr:uncharacterized protein LOC105340373 [Crassostrea gigas]|eukprot:XP_019927831.1 PREDICTED: uncharacterized protein LOC105340373 [Crassostrea gigas]
MEKFLVLLVLLFVGISHHGVSGNRGGALFAFRDFGSARDHSLWVLPSAPQSGAIVAGDLLLVPLIPIDRRNSPSNSRPRRTASPTFPSAFHLLQDFIRSTTGQFEH